MKFGFEIDTKAQDEGAWVPLTLPGADGIEVKLRSSRGEKFRRAVDRVTEHHSDEKLKRALRSKKRERSGPAAIRLYREVVADFCLLDWRGMKDSETGAEVAYSRDLAYQLMTEAQYEVFADAVVAAAGSVGLASDDDDADDLDAEGDDLPEASAP